MSHPQQRLTPDYQLPTSFARRRNEVEPDRRHLRSRYSLSWQVQDKPGSFDISARLVRSGLHTLLLLALDSVADTSFDVLLLVTVEFSYTVLFLSPLGVCFSPMLLD